MNTNSAIISQTAGQIEKFALLVFLLLLYSRVPKLCKICRMSYMRQRLGYGVNMASSQVKRGVFLTFCALTFTHQAIH